MSAGYKLSYLDSLESESIHIIREVFAGFEKPVLLYSVGKDSSCLLRLAQKAFYPGKIPFPLLHVDTSYKFSEMIKFRDQIPREQNVNLIVHRNEEYIQNKMHPSKHGLDKCCKFLKTRALLGAVFEGNYDVAIGGARREEERSRAKERIFSVRDKFGAWDPKNQRPELWSLFNSRINKGESVRVFPLSNWTEVDIWNYIKREKIKVVPLYFARKRKIIRRNGLLLLADEFNHPGPGESVEEKMIRFRTLGCSPCSGAVESDAGNIDMIIDEVVAAKKSERENRAIDYGSEGSMETKKTEGYF